MEGQEIADLQAQNQFSELAEQNSSEEEGYEESFMGEGQSDLQPEDLETETGTPAAATTTPSPAVSTPEMFNRSPTPTTSVPPSPADFGPQGENGNASFTPYSRSLQEDSTSNGQREQISEPVRLADVPVPQSLDTQQHSQQF